MSETGAERQPGTRYAVQGQTYDTYDRIVCGLCGKPWTLAHEKCEESCEGEAVESEGTPGATPNKCSVCTSSDPQKRFMAYNGSPEKGYRVCDYEKFHSPTTCEYILDKTDDKLIRCGRHATFTSQLGGHFCESHAPKPAGGTLTAEDYKRWGKRILVGLRRTGSLWLDSEIPDEVQRNFIEDELRQFDALSVQNTAALTREVEHFSKQNIEWANACEKWMTSRRFQLERAETAEDKLKLAAAEIGRLKGELAAIDEGLARRPALSDLKDRYSKVYRACELAGRAEFAEAELTRLRGQGLANELIGCGLCEWRGKLRDFQVHHKTHVVPQSPEQGAPELLPLAIEWRKTNWYDSVPQQLDQALAAFAAYVLDPERAVPQLPAKPLTGESNMGFGKQAGKEDSSQ